MRPSEADDFLAPVSKTAFSARRTKTQDGDPRRLPAEDRARGDAHQGDGYEQHEKEDLEGGHADRDEGHGRVRAASSGTLSCFWVSILPQIGCLCIRDFSKESEHFLG